MADQLRQILAHTLSPDATTRRQAEKQLDEASKGPGHPIQILQIVASGDANDALIRQAAAIHFKNLVKKNWDEAGDDATVVIPMTDRDTIKANLVELMCTVPPQIRSQCSEAVSLIASVDYPKKWKDLLPGLISKFGTQDMSVLNGVLETANSIFKRFRFVERTDALYEVILFSLKLVQEPLLRLFQQLGQQVDALSGDANQLKPRFEALRTMSRIFYSLNYQDLPEYFEDHMGEWMAEFAKYLQYKNPILVDEDEETEPSVVDALQVAIIENLYLYASKDEEPFLPHISSFTQLVWGLQLGLSTYSKHDTLATTSIKFLNSLVSKPMHRGLFEAEATLKEIISKIVMPNLMIREVDEERFEDDPQEFILGDIEGSDTDSRRKRSQELLRSMNRQFEDQVTNICLEHIHTAMNEFNSNPSEKWAAKDVAIHLMLAISIRTESAMGGVTALNDKVNVMEFFTTHIVPELQDTNPSTRPMVKATCIKFVTTFRNQFSRENLPALMPLLIAHLASPNVVVHTYSSIAVDKTINGKVPGPNGKLVAKFVRADLNPYLEPLLTGLFSIQDNAGLPENEYVMKCIMRLLNFAKEDVASVTEIILSKLTASLERVSKNPRNPQYNHYLFESISVLVRSVCSKDASYTEFFEGRLFPPFQVILQLDVSEFTPYVFQVLAQLLEYRSQQTGLGQAYESLFAPLVNPTLYERRGNIPALCRLLEAYLGKAASWIVSQGHLVKILGVFQKLMATGATEKDAFDLLGAIVRNVPMESLQPYLKEIFRIVLMRLQTKKTTKNVRLITQFFALFIGLFGTQAWFDQMNTLQAGLGFMTLTQVWVPRLTTDMPVRMEAKVQVVGLTKLLCETPALANDSNGQTIWAQVLASTVRILTSPEAALDGMTNDEDDDMDTEITYDAAYSILVSAVRPATDPFPDVANPAMSFVQSLHRLCSSTPGRFPPIIHQSLQSDAKLMAGFQSMIQKAGVTIP